MRYRAVFVLAFLLFAVLSCAGKNERNHKATLDDFIRIGKTRLAAGDASGATDAFDKALAMDGDNTDARFGLVLAGTLNFFSFTNKIADSVGGLSFSTSKSYEKDDSDSSASSDAIRLYLKEEVIGPIDRNESLYASLLDGPDFRFDLDRFDLTIAGTTIASLSGVYDKTDLHFFAALNALFGGITRFLLAYDLRFDYQAMVLPQADPNADTLDQINGYVNFLDGLLTSEAYPDFLRLDGEEGARNLKRAGIDLGNAFTRLDKVFLSLAGETHAQDKDVIRYYDADENGRYDIGTDAVFLGNERILEPEMALAIRDAAEKLARGFYEGSAMDANPAKVDFLSLADFNGVFEAMGIFPIGLGNPLDPFIIEGFPGWIEVDVGSFFARPEADGLRDFLSSVVGFWNFIYGLTGG